ncbi:hypothetical protein Hanom_Chr06g00552761 [Helianthus anomalus]
MHEPKRAYNCVRKLTSSVHSIKSTFLNHKQIYHHLFKRSHRTFYRELKQPERVLY